jgi:hypothetical protein
VGQEFHDEATGAAGTIAFFTLDAGWIVAPSARHWLWPSSQEMLGSGLERVEAGPGEPADE